MPPQKVRKAVIPAAGFGTRLYPATKAIKKELFPIIDRDGRAKPLILAIVEEALSAGIEEVAIIVQEGDRDIFSDFFQSPPPPELWQKLSAENREYSQYLRQLGDRVTILTQDKPEGYGYAVFCSKDWVHNEPFLLLLGDHVYRSNLDISCAKQLVNIYQQRGKSAIGLTIMSADIIHKAGCVAGTWQENKSILEIDQIYEKPTLEYAKQHLRVEGLKNDEFLGIFGMYVLESKIFDLLADDINHNRRYKGEFQLTTCLDTLHQKYGAIAYLVQGQYFDTGMPQFYRQTVCDW
ncbi:MAG: UTP--glucose-1-phosphate uridylyltransferase GalU [Pleurocapsa sp.]